MATASQVCMARSPACLHLAVTLAGLPDVVRKLALAVGANVGDHAALLHHLAGHRFHDVADGLFAQLRLGHGKQLVERHRREAAAAMLNGAERCAPLLPSKMMSERHAAGLMD